MVKLSTFQPDDITEPFSGHGEDDLEAPAHRPAAAEVMVDADDDV